MSMLADRLSLRIAPPPAAALEISAAQVAAASFDWRGGRVFVAAHGVEPLPPGAVVPSLTAHNVHDRAALSAAVRRVLELIGRPRRIGLIVPDAAAKVSLMRFEQVPARAQDLDQLIRWQVRKAAPFPIEQAQVGYLRGASGAEGHDFIVTLARLDVVQEYEAACAAEGAHAGVVDISTFNVVNAALAAGAPTGDWLLVNLAGGSAAVVILRGGHPIFFRSPGADGEGTLVDLVHQTAMYYEDRLQGSGFERVMLAGHAADEVRRTLEERLATAVEAVDPLASAALTDRVTATPALVDTLTPLVGFLMRGRAKAVA